MQRLLSSVYDQFRDMTDELHGFEEIRFKNMIISQACVNQVKDCNEQSLQLFSTWMKTDDPDNNNMWGFINYNNNIIFKF